jgi:hypothetical protein
MNEEEEEDIEKKEEEEEENKVSLMEEDIYPVPVYFPKKYKKRTNKSLRMRRLSKKHMNEKEGKYMKKTKRRMYSSQEEDTDKEEEDKR